MWGFMHIPLLASPSCPQTSFPTCYGVAHSGQGVLLVGLGFEFLRRQLAVLMKDMWSWSIIKMVCRSSIIDAPWTPSPSVSPLCIHPRHLHKSLPTSLVMRVMAALFEVELCVFMCVVGWGHPLQVNKTDRGRIYHDEIMCITV